MTHSENTTSVKKTEDDTVKTSEVKASLPDQDTLAEEVYKHADTEEFSEETQDVSDNSSDSGDETEPVKIDEDPVDMKFQVPVSSAESSTEAPTEEPRILKIRAELSRYKELMGRLVISNPKDLQAGAKSLSYLLHLPIITKDPELRKKMIEELLKFFIAEKDGLAKENSLFRGFDALEKDVTQRASMIATIFRMKTTGRSNEAINEKFFITSFKKVTNADPVGFLQYFELRRKGMK
jgi:hypothetical protein